LSTTNKNHSINAIRLMLLSQRKEMEKEKEKQKCATVNRKHNKYNTQYGAKPIQCLYR
jgi:hypothetical protein